MEKKTFVRREREIIELLLKEGTITQDMLQRARDESKRTGLNIKVALEKLGYIQSEEVVKLQAKALGIPYMDLSNYLVDEEILKIIPRNLAQQYQVVPLFRVGQSLTIGMVDPQDIVTMDQVRRICKVEILEPILVSEKSIAKVLDTHTEVTSSIEETIRSVNEEKISKAEGKGLNEAAEEAPIIKLVNLIISQAASARASDIHVEPEENDIRVRLRVDGVLEEMCLLPKKLQTAVISRIKILSGLDIAESRKPQDGRIRMKMEQKNLDIRVSTFPTVNGENVVMRLLDKTAVVLGLKEMGLMEQDLKIFSKLILHPHGIIFITGPTGSGKTSTLYAALTAISNMEKNIVTIEDPVEYEFPLIRQTQVNPKADITFSSGLRSILRQDPDVIMVGEIRDKETSEVAVQAALTGHLVFSTLHTNDAPSALTRLVDMGVEPFLISSATIGIVAQRLVRVICEKCKEKYEPISPVILKLGQQYGLEFWRGAGCKHCKNTGYAGRRGIFEILVMDEQVRKQVDAGVSSEEIKRVAVSAGMRTLFQCGIEQVRLGVTTIDEVLRVTALEG